MRFQQKTQGIRLLTPTSPRLSDAGFPVANCATGQGPSSLTRFAVLFQNAGIAGDLSVEGGER